MAVVSVSDVWYPVVGVAGQTRTVSGAGTTAWASVVIDNGSGLDVMVSNSPGAPPANRPDAWRLVSAGTIVTLPLGTAGVAYRIPGVPADGAVVQTTLSTEPTAGGGSPGTVNIGSGTITITGPTDVNVANVPTVDVSGPVSISGGPINVETAAGVSLATAARVTYLTAITVPAAGGFTSAPIAVPADTQSILFEWPGANPLQIRVIGTFSLARYFGQVIDGVSVARAPFDPGTDDHIIINVQQALAGVATDLQVSASSAPAILSSPDLFPFSETAALQFGVRNIHVRDVSGKQFFVATSTIAGVVPLIPATPNTAYSGYSFMAIPDAAVAGNWLQVGGLMVLPSAGGPFPIGFDFRGAIVALTGAALNLTQIGGPATWRVHITAAQLTT